MEEEPRKKSLGRRASEEERHWNKHHLEEDRTMRQEEPAEISADSFFYGIAIRIVIPINHLQAFVPSVLFYDCLFQSYHFGVGFIISSPGQLAFR